MAFVSYQYATKYRPMSVGRSVDRSVGSIDQNKHTFSSTGSWMPAAIDITKASSESCGSISRNTDGRMPGFTASITTSDPAATCMHACIRDHGRSTGTGRGRGRGRAGAGARVGGGGRARARAGGMGGGGSGGK